VQQTNLALMLLGQVPNPETGEHVQDLDAARLMIDQLEMIEVKTKGNLDQREEQLLKQSLTSLRMIFVDAVEAGPRGATQSTPTAASSQPHPAPDSASVPASESSATPAAEEEHRKKFSKKY
jgi:hypothetical protein